MIQNQRQTSKKAVIEIAKQTDILAKDKGNNEGAMKAIVQNLMEMKTNGASDSEIVYQVFKLRMKGVAGALHDYMEKNTEGVGATLGGKPNTYVAILNSLRRKGSVGDDDFLDARILGNAMAIRDVTMYPYANALFSPRGMGYTLSNTVFTRQLPMNILHTATLGVLKWPNQVDWSNHMGTALRATALSTAILGAEIGGIGLVTGYETLQGTGYNMITAVPQTVGLVADGTATTLWRTGKAAWNGNNILDWRNVGTQFYYFVDRPPSLAFQNKVSELESSVVDIARNGSDPAAAIAAAIALKPEIETTNTSFKKRL